MITTPIIHTSESLKSLDSDLDNFHYQLDDGDQYKLTDGEFEWLQFVTNSYSIAQHIWDNSKCDENDDLIYTVDTIGMGEALKADDSYPKAVCLSDDTALQAVIFYSAVDLSE